MHAKQSSAMDDVVMPYPFLKKLRIRNLWVREFLGEFLGTFVLILFGDASLAQPILYGQQVDGFAVNWAWGVAVMLCIAICGNVSGAHINPAVTTALATLGKFPWKKVAHYIIAQHLGAFVGSAVVYYTYIDALNAYDPMRTTIGPNSTALIWAPYPKPYVSNANYFLGQIVGTALMMFTVRAVVDEKNLNLPRWLLPVMIGFMVTAMGLCFDASLNPARDFATRCFTAVAGYGSIVFSYRNFWWVGLFGPHIGAIIGGWIYYLGIELHWPDETTEDERRAILN